MTVFDKWSVQRSGEKTAPRAYLIGQRGETDEFYIELPVTPFTIGRTNDAMLQLNDEWISRLHCEIWCEGGLHRIKDLGSKNGTWLNEWQVREAPLCEGDRIRIGNIWLAYTHTPEGRPLRAGETIGETEDLSVTMPLPPSNSRPSPWPPP